MVIDDFDVESVSVPPSKTNPPLVVDTNAPLAATVASKLLQKIRRRNAKEIERSRTMELSQFPQGNALDIGGPFSGKAPGENFFRFVACERLNH